jgi:hypothetical protein
MCLLTPTLHVIPLAACRATLVICPVVAVIQWRQEIARYTAPGSVKVTFCCPTFLFVDRLLFRFCGQELNDCTLHSTRQCQGGGSACMRVLIVGLGLGLGQL